jgi:hypothetical protein
LTIVFLVKRLFLGQRPNPNVDVVLDRYSHNAIVYSLFGNGTHHVVDLHEPYSLAVKPLTIVQLLGVLGMLAAAMKFATGTAQQIS